MFPRWPLSQRAAAVAAIGILLGLVAAVYGRSIGFDFVWDDQIFVTDKAAYRNLDLRSIFFSLSANGLEYLPVRDLTYVLDFALWGRSSAGFHFSNLVYFSLAVLAVRRFAAQLAASLHTDPQGASPGQAGLVGFLAATLFAVHPINCEVVNFVTGRNALVSALFFFLAAHAYLAQLTGPRNKRAAWYSASVACYVLALFSKATAITLPGVLLLLHALPAAPRDRRRWLGLLPFALIAGAGFFAFRAVAQRTHVIAADQAAALSSFGAKAAVAVQIPVFYLTKLLYPRGFSADYGTEQFASRLADPRVLVCLLIVGGTSCAAWLARKRFPALALAAAWFFVTIIPVLNLFPTSPVVADRYAFLPSFAICFLTAAIGALLFARQPVPAAAIATALVLGLAALSFRQSAAWKDTVALWERTLAVSPRSTKALSNLGRFYFIEKKEYDAGLALFKRAQDADPRNPNYDLFLGALMIMRNDPRGAIAPLSRALALDPQRMETLINLGVAHEALGDPERAREFYRRAAHSTQADPAGNVREQAWARLRRLGG